MWIKSILIFPKNCFNFRSDMIKKQDIINLSSYSSKNSIILCDSEGRMQPFIQVSIVFYLHTVLIKFSCLPYFRRYFTEVCSFSAFNFCRTVSSSFFIKCPSLMSNWQFIIYSVSLCVISGGFPSRFLKCSFHF